MIRPAIINEEEIILELMRRHYDRTISAADDAKLELFRMENSERYYAYQALAALWHPRNVSKKELEESFRKLAAKIASL